MITLLTGDNSFEIERALSKLASDFEGDVERIDGENLQLKQLPDLFMGGNLFSNERMIFIRDLSANKTIWPTLPEWFDRVSEDIHVFFVDPKVDKRTATYKALKKTADVREFTSWGARDWMVAEKWVIEEATRQGVKLDKKIAHQLVDMVGMDQWSLFHAIEKLSVIDDVSPDVLADIIDRTPSDNAFGLLEIALSGDSVGLRSMLTDLKLTEDPYRLFGLLSSQVFNLVVIASAMPGIDISRDFGIHPFVVSKSKNIVAKLSVEDISRLLDVFVKADTTLKTSTVEPWIIIEGALANALLLNKS